MLWWKDLWTTGACPHHHSFFHSIASNTGKINQVPGVHWCEGKWMGHLLTKLIFSLFQVIKYSCFFFLFFFFFLAGAGGLPPHPLSPQCHSFVLTNGCAWYQTVVIGLTNTHAHTPSCLLKAPAISYEQVHFSNRLGRRTESAFMLLSIVPLLSHKPKICSEWLSGIENAQRRSCWKAVHDIRGHLFLTEVVVWLNAWPVCGYATVLCYWWNMMSEGRSCCSLSFF